MSDTDINIVLRQLDIINDKVDSLGEVHIKNGGGRDITYKRSEFFQMLYDWRKEQFSLGSANAKGLGNYFALFLQVAQIIVIIAAMIKIGGK